MVTQSQLRDYDLHIQVVELSELVGIVLLSTFVLTGRVRARYQSCRALYLEMAGAKSARHLLDRCILCEIAACRLSFSACCVVVTEVVGILHKAKWKAGSNVKEEAPALSI